ncbi:MAG: hypothetical protein M0037_00870 [Betaproteobacteria bacterium]|nr:hypothetical protein [Betaproteobacteria bacterium]
MAAPTIASRLKRRFVVMTSDDRLLDRLKGELPAAWEMVATRDLETLGDYQDILLFRFLFLDLDEQAAFDPLDIVDTVRREHMLNLPIFCFGGSEALRDAARLARADRFFERDEVTGKVRLFCAQYRWGEEAD